MFPKFSGILRPVELVLFNINTVPGRGMVLQSKELFCAAKAERTCIHFVQTPQLPSVCLPASVECFMWAWVEIV